MIEAVRTPRGGWRRVTAGWARLLVVALGSAALAGAGSSPAALVPPPGAVLAAVSATPATPVQPPATAPTSDVSTTAAPATAVPVAVPAAPPEAAPPAGRATTAGLTIVIVDNGVAGASAGARRLVDEVLGSAAAANRALIGRFTIRVNVIPVGRELTDLADFAFLKGQATFDGRPYSSLRGVGPTLDGSVVAVAVGAEQILPGGESTYGSGFAISHETGHIVRHVGLTAAEDARLKAIYAARRASQGPWLTSYTASNDDEYFADATAAWFGHPWSPSMGGRFSRAWLTADDAAMAALLREVYGLS
jgi:hypothetical protein